MPVRVEVTLVCVRPPMTHVAPSAIMMTLSTLCFGKAMASEPLNVTLEFSTCRRSPTER